MPLISDPQLAYMPFLNSWEDCILSKWKYLDKTVQVIYSYWLFLQVPIGNEIFPLPLPAEQGG